MHAINASFDRPFDQLVSSPAAAVGGSRAGSQLDANAACELVEAGRRARRGGLVVAVMLLTAALPMLSLSGAFPEYLRAIQSIGLTCWVLSSAQGIALFTMRRRAFLSACAQHGLASQQRWEVERWLEGTDCFSSRTLEEQASALLLFLRTDASAPRVPHAPHHE